jgi:4-hydroxy-tetrahydrodipicolinate synthase
MLNTMILSRRVALATGLAPLCSLKVAFGTTATVPTGLWPVMLTPFKEDKTIDWNALDALTDWYLENGADGLFACCQSSEVWELTEQERLQVAARVVKRAGRKPVVAGGLPGFAPKNVAEFVSALQGHGVRAAVITTCQVAEKSDSDAVWRERTGAILEASTALPFGLYEAPSPYKRLLTPDTMHWAAATDRFVFYKDTSCDIDAIAAKVPAVRGTPLRLFNAHVPILVDAMKKGAHGFSGIAANAYPKVVSFAVHHQGDDPARVAAMQEFLTRNEPVLNVNYPMSAKVLAGLAGVPIQPVCRRKNRAFTPPELEKLRELRKSADRAIS